MDNGSEITAKKVSKVRRIVRYTVAVAASILLIVVCMVGYNFYQLSPGRLFNENYIAYELMTARSVNDSTGSEIEKTYREKKYTEVINIHKSSVLSVKDVSK